MIIEIRREQSGMYRAMGKWFVHEHSQCPRHLISRVYQTYSKTPSLDVTTLGLDSFEFPEPVNGEYLSLRIDEKRVIDEVIKRESERYQIN